MCPLLNMAMLSSLVKAKRKEEEKKEEEKINSDPENEEGLGMYVVVCERNDQEK